MDYQINEWIEVPSGVMGGKPVIKGTRLDVEMVISHLLAGDTEDDVLAAFPSLTVESFKGLQRFWNKDVRFKIFCC